MKKMEKNVCLFLPRWLAPAKQVLRRILNTQLTVLLQNSKHAEMFKDSDCENKNVIVCNFYESAQCNSTLSVTKKEFGR